jgi:hypothetical protein
MSHERRSARQVLDGTGHREPKDWQYESVRQIQDAENTIRIGNTDRLHSHNTINFGSKVDTTNDTRVERALKSKLNQTTKLKGLLEETLAKTNTEIAKMVSIKKYLTEERSKFEARYARNQVGVLTPCGEFDCLPESLFSRALMIPLRCRTFPLKKTHRIFFFSVLHWTLSHECSLSHLTSLLRFFIRLKIG